MLETKYDKMIKNIVIKKVKTVKLSRTMGDERRQTKTSGNRRP